ncbi:probable G-protein coupled receptor 158 [Dunckerocampus dactyliophorus]|uniref:probable G-protein coupled receptor 158 n=1 Tax=Dunckerocampus dactyliophorus TaxID=161453 RepID=UPI0024052ADD|nr:probable G-protein coupled receptor 158 [Dunckerocampus dactyliophorus]
MCPVWLFLLPSLLRAQVTPELPAGDVSKEDVSNSTSIGDPPGSPPTPSDPTEPAGAATNTSQAPLEDDWTPAENFLYTGDSSAVEVARCARGYSPPGQSGSLPDSFSAPLRPALDALANTANFLNMIFQASDLRESTVQEDMEWYHALVRALLEADGLIRRALLTFDCNPASPAPQLVLRASRGLASKMQAIVLQDLSKTWEHLHLPPPAPDDSWFRRFKFPESSPLRPVLSKRVLLNDLSTLDTPKWGRGDSYVTNGSGVRWASAPYLDCQDGRFVPRWMLTLSTSFYGLKPDLTPEFRGVIRVDVDIQDVDLDQCVTGDGWFADTHQCNRTSMECVPIPGRGFRLGQYCCRCKEGYYNPETATWKADGGSVNTSASSISSQCYPSMPTCLPCWPGCRRCQDGAPCWVQEDWLLRVGVLAVQGTFMVLIFISMLVAYRHRRSRRIRASGLLLLEIILFGSLLLYFPVFILYFKPSTFRCILLRWVRMLGFSIVYGTLTLKMYRVLKVFLSRTAQRVPYMSSLHLLRILGVMLMTVSWFLCAWTVGVLQNRDRNIPVFVTGSTSEGQDFNLCYLDRWDYMMAVAELLFLCWGSSLWTAVRPVPSAFHEPRYMGIAIHNELLLSTMFHLCRFTFPSLHPDWMLLLSFAHTHVTITVTLALLFIPKFLYMSKPGREEIAAEVYEDEVDLRRSYLNSSFRSAWSERSVDPDDFRDELKRLYSQLEVNKAKKMSTNNPHLSKKRSSRCALGRSIIKRIAEIPESVSRQCSREDRDGSFRSTSGNHSGSFRRAADNLSIRSSMKSPSPSPHKSPSDHYYVRESSFSRDSSMLRINAVKRSSQRSETDSLDIHPAVCKSVSAQNLTIDTNLLHPDHTRLHKSWSLTSTTNHSVENMTMANGSTSRQSLSISEQTRSALQSESFDKAEVCPWEVAQEQSGDKSHKHVTYAKSQDEDAQSPTSPVALVCPWDHLLPLENKRPQDKGETESPQPQAPVSASAPGSPRSKVNKDQRVFSFRNTTTKWLSVKSFLTSVEAASRSSKDETLNREDSVSQKSQESVSSTSRSGTSSRHPSMERRNLQKRSMTTADGKPCLVKQNAIRLSSGDSSDRSPRRLVIVKSTIYPGDADDIQRDGTYENVFLSRQSSKRSSISSWDTASSSRTPSTHRRGSKRLAGRNVSHADICPWEGLGALQKGEGSKQQQSIKADICPWETGSSNVCPWESHQQDMLKRQESGRADVCPWESQDVPSNSHVVSSKTQLCLKRSADICPWETAETPLPIIRQDSEYANVCLWEVQDNAEVVYENLNPIETKGSLKVPSRQVAMKAAVYPSMSGQGQLNPTKSPVLLIERKMTKTEESCPWDFPDPPQIMEDGGPLEEGKVEPTTRISPLQIIIKADVCPGDSRQQDKLNDSKGVLPLDDASSQRKTTNVSVNVCPWDSEQPLSVKTDIMSKNHVRQDTSRANVCPWETEEAMRVKTEASQKLQQQRAETQKVQEKQDSTRSDFYPWETEEQKVLTKQDSSRENVCPWEVENPKILKKEDSSRENLCPWESKQPKVLTKQDSSRADVCPWETDEPKVFKKQDSSRESVCPWETEGPKVLTKQDSCRTDVCPWEVEEPKVLEKRDSSRESVCPWETEGPKVLTKQDSSRTDVCPWEVEEPKVLDKQNSSRENICPRESEDAKSVKKQDSTRGDVCPWETEEPKVLKKQDSSKADVCPLDKEESKVFKKPHSSQTSVCPWETDDSAVLKKQETVRPDVCPWETEETGSVIDQDGSGTQVCPGEIQDPQPPSQPNEVPENQGLLSDEQLDGPKASLALGRRDALCPWEMVRSSSGSFTDNNSDVFTWEPENIPEEDEDDDAECAAEALIFPPDL